MTRKERAAEYQRRCYAANQALADTYLDECVDCENEDPLVLEFDHIHPDGPRARRDWRSRRTLASRSRPTMLAELELCEVRCANCHKRRHRLDVVQ